MGTPSDATAGIALLIRSLEDLCPCRVSREKDCGAQCYDTGDPQSFCQCTVDRPISTVCAWPLHRQVRSILRAIAVWAAGITEVNKRGIPFVPNRHLKRLELLINERGGYRYGA